jgi:hypothetical protein
MTIEHRTIEAALAAFWATVSALHPEITTGDLPPDVDIEFDQKATEAIGAWLEFNAPPKPLYFSGDWCIDDVPGPATAYEAVRFGPSWNGWVTPVVTKTVAEHIVERQQQIARDNPDIDSQMLAWHNDDLLVIEPDNDPENHPLADVIHPTEDGLYGIGLGWCWWSAVNTDGIDYRVVLSNGGVFDYTPEGSHA